MLEPEEIGVLVLCVDDELGLDDNPPVPKRPPPPFLEPPKAKRATRAIAAIPMTRIIVFDMLL